MSGIVFSPLLPMGFIIAVAIALFAISGAGLYRGLRGSWLRVGAGLALVLALLNPALMSEDREPLKTIVPVIVDRSQSQALPERQAMTDRALAELKARLARFPRLEPRVVEASGRADSDSPSTALFEALRGAIADLPPTRIGAAIFITDGEVHDLPGKDSVPGLTAPLHALITGQPDETDRRIEIVRAPRFGIVGEDQDLTFRLIEDGTGSTAPVTVSLRLNGAPLDPVQAVPGAETTIRVPVANAGNNILELAADPLAGEISAANNRAVQQIEGIREKLRVLLVSGEPHAGERAWRNLLKSDAAVDLVHFTILRPPEKQDGTPINELSLIAFPTRELFVDKIKDFDLIIFDRYQHRGVLPLVYYDNIAEYVRQGGAVLIAAGPEHAGPESMAMTPLSTILPVIPTGAINEDAFYPRLSDTGRKHPLTRGLEGADSEPPRWGRWFRAVDVGGVTGETVMEDGDKRPLLVLSRVGEGRVAMLLSDQGWLWSRGFEGGGPYVALYRRIAHWLMKEPALEEEALTASATASTVTISRQTIGDDPGPAEVTLPSGKVERWPLTQDAPGLYTATRHVAETGLYAIRNGALTALTHAGAVDAPEFKAMVSTTERLAPYARASGGTIARISPTPASFRLPDVLPVNGAVRTSEPAPENRMAIRISDDSVLKGVSSLPLLAGFLGLALLLAALSTTWWREGR